MAMQPKLLHYKILILEVPVANIFLVEIVLENHAKMNLDKTFLKST